MTEYDFREFGYYKVFKSTCGLDEPYTRTEFEDEGDFELLSQAATHILDQEYEDNVNALHEKGYSYADKKLAVEGVSQTEAGNRIHQRFLAPDGTCYAEALLDKRFSLCAEDCSMRELKMRFLNKVRGTETEYIIYEIPEKENNNEQ